jgi:hypothetical protein
VSSSATGATGYFVTDPAYNTTLPTVPFYDVTVGQNFANVALVGYDLVTGWGTVDAYNFTMYFVTYVPANTPGDLSSLRADFNLTGLRVNSTSPFYNASIQQNFFVANALGAPIYWVQNVVYINGTPGAWNMNFSGWVVYPFWGIYPSDTIYEYNFPVTGQLLNTPLNFSIVTSLENTTVVDGQSVEFSFGIPGASSLSLPLPGGSYILGSLWNNYSWGGNNYTNNPLEGGLPGSISPQFGLVGGPSGGLGTFRAPTAGNLQLLFQRFGSNQWVPGGTQAYGDSIDQTGESSLGLLWTESSPGNPSNGTPANWTLSVSSGSTEQGVLEYDQATFVPTVPLTINESGLPANAYWGFYLNTGQGFSTNGHQLVLQVANGSFTWNAYPPAGYTLAVGHGQFVIDGSPFQISLVFHQVTYNVTLVALALPSGFEWWANVTEIFDQSMTMDHLESTTTTITFAAANGSLVIAFAAQSNWTEQPHQISFNVTGNNVEYAVAFAPPPTFVTTFVATGLPLGAVWTINVSGQPSGQPSSAVSVNLPLKNGSYSYVARTNDRGYFAASGVFGVDGFAHEIFIAFLPAVYAVTFNESGLPAGSLWGLQILDGPYLSSAGGQLNWSAVNGTYNYTVLAEPAGWTAGPFTQGQISVNGSAASLSIHFTQVEYAVTFSMSGLPAIASWGVSLDGATANFTTASTLSFSLPNGTYTYTVSVPAGWSASPTSGSFSVTGQAGTVGLVASQRGGTTGSAGPLGLGNWGYALIALLVVLVLVALGVAWWRRRPPEEPRVEAHEETYDSEALPPEPPVRPPVP